MPGGRLAQEEIRPGLFTVTILTLTDQKSETIARSLKREVAGVPSIPQSLRSSLPQSPNFRSVFKSTSYRTLIASFPSP